MTVGAASPAAGHVLGRDAELTQIDDWLRASAEEAAGPVSPGHVLIIEGERHRQDHAVERGGAPCPAGRVAGALVATQLGTGSTGGGSTAPVAVTGGFISDGAIGSGQGMAMCALNQGQQAFCWGDNEFGELGDGTSGAGTDTGTPTAVQGL